MATINEQTDCVSAVFHACLGGNFIVRLTHDNGIGLRSGDVLDDCGRTIGSASDYIYSGRGWAIHTRPYAGFVPNHQVTLV